MSQGCEGEKTMEHTHERTIELRVAIQTSRDTSEPRVVVVARLHQPLAGRDFAPQSLALGAIRVIVDGVWPVTSVVGD